MSNSNIAKLRRSRTLKRNALNRAWEDVNKVLQGDTVYDEYELQARYEVVTEVLPQIKALDVEVADLIDEDDVAEADCEEAMNFSIKMKVLLKKIEAYMKTRAPNDGRVVKEDKPGYMSSDEKDDRSYVNEDDSCAGDNFDLSENFSVSEGVQLPKIKIKSFDGSIDAWQPFIDIFEAAIDRKDNLADIEKFTYLKGFLEGEALQCIEGFPLSGKNYKHALDLLKERFGNTQFIISSHMNRLINLEKINSCDAKQLRRIYDQIENNVRALSAVGIASDHFGPLLIPIVLEKLPNAIKLQISRDLGVGNWDVDAFIKCINKEIVAREHFQHLDSDRDSSNYTSSSLAISTDSAKVCIFCDNNHYSDKCRIVTDLDARREIVRKKKRCYRCLKGTHLVKSCRIFVKCYKCKAVNNHHTAFCQAVKRDGNFFNENKQGHRYENRSNDTQSSSHATCLVDRKKSVLLQTAICDVLGNNNRCITIKALFDSCSQQSYIADRLVKILNLKPLRSINMMVKTFCNEPKKLDVKEYEIKVKSYYGDVIPVKVVAVPVICEGIGDQVVKKAVNVHSFLQDLPLADDGKNPDAEVEMLIGADVYWKFVSNEIRRDDVSGLTAINSKFGWLLNGPISCQKDVTSSVVLTESSTMHIAAMIDEDELNKVVHKFWDLDTVESSTMHIAAMIDEDELNKVVHKFWDLDTGVSILPDNFNLCEKRLGSLKKRLDKNTELKKRYNDVFQEQLDAGIIEEVKEQGKLGMVTYLPHREVIKDERTSTKLRVVFDASAKLGDSPCLNEVLFKGPNITPLLYDVLLRFRVFPIGLTADIEKAYLQVSVAEKHRDFMRCLWYNDIFSDDPKIIKLRFCRVIFGAAPSQFLLNGTLKKFLSEYVDVDPEFVKKMEDSFYVDDFCSAVPTIDEGYKLFEKVKSRFSSVKFNVRKWKTNSMDLKRSICESEGVMLHENDIVSVLGLSWNTQEDSLKIDFRHVFENLLDLNPTKRNILKRMASMFDPCGFLQNISISLKILFQEICNRNREWDKVIDDDLKKKWKEITSVLEEYGDVTIPRYFFFSLNKEFSSVYLHGFSDGSLSGYGCCIYLKATSEDGNAQVTFVTAKSRVIPSNKKMTVPRAELMGNFLLVKLLISVKQAIGELIHIRDIICWTDSMVSLYWIKSKSKKDLKVFEQNRVKFIAENTSSEKWFHCKSEENPADVVSKWGFYSKVYNKILIDGPSFIKDMNEQQFLLNANNGVIDLAINDEYVEDVNLTCNDNVLELNNIENVVDINRFNCLNRLLRVSVFVSRFIQNLKRVISKEQLILNRYATVEEINDAKLMWIQSNQMYLKRDANYKNVHLQLNLFEDEQLVIRSKGRISNAYLPYETKNPVMLYRDHYLTRLIVLHYHLVALHRGVNQTLSEFRTKYWIVRARSYIKNIIAKCVLCKRIQGRSYAYPNAPDLPVERVTASRPFIAVGVDHCGPLFVRNIYDADDEEVNKCYIVLYTCTATRGIILDIVRDASSASFIESFRRFIARRGCPSVVLSDNGTAFTAVETKEFVSEKGIEWKFNVAAAPWTGGFYERLVACVKNSLKKVLGRSSLRFDELSTVIFEIELMINSRPLMSLSGDLDEEELTPNHLLFGGKLEKYPNDSEKNSNQSISRRWSYVKKLQNHFWNRWQKEYLTSLREFQKSSSPESTSRKPKVNDVVIVKDEKIPRQTWRLGRILSVRYGRDNNIRSARLLLSRTRAIIDRPINLLYPIESDL